MNITAIYVLLFQSYAGVGILIGAGLVISLILCIVLERRTRKTYEDRGPRSEDDEWSIFDSDDEEESKPSKKPAKKTQSKPSTKKRIVKKVEE